jgi:very-short-patch-repair endonuclease
MRSTILTEERSKDLRRAMSQPERTLWAMLRRNQLGLHFRRQHPLGPYILDFYCAAAKLCVEVDGPVHEGRTSRDEYRTRRLAEDGVRVIRFTMDDVERRPAWVIAEIKTATAPSTG